DRAAGPAPKPANSLAGLPVAHPFHSAADRLPVADREPVVVTPPAATGNPIRHKSKLHSMALDMFRMGFDTIQIAQRLGISEARASRCVYEARTHELGYRVSTRPNERWGRR